MFSYWATVATMRRAERGTLPPTSGLLPSSSPNPLPMSSRRCGLVRIAPQGTGHGAMPMESLENAMLLKTSRMRRVDINASALIARAEAGAQWQDVTVPAAAYGLAALAGSSPNVGVTGYTLGGGLGWLARRYGLAANSVTGGLSRRRGRGRRAASSATRARPRRSTPSRQSPRRSSSNSIWTPNSHCRWRAMGCSSLTPQPT